MKFSPILGILSILTVVTTMTAIAQADISTTSPRQNQGSKPRLSTPQLAVTNLETSIHQQIDRYRQSHNLPPLALDPAISAQAKAHSEQMAKLGNLSHNGFHDRVESISQTISYRGAAENVAYNMGYKQPDEEAVKGWLESPGHHKNIIGNFDLTGIGVSQNAKGEYYFTQIFIRKS
jgi:uncharacterized protein YkwD